MKTLTKELLQELFEYKEGNLWWKEQKINRRLDKPVGSVNINGRRTVWLLKKNYLVHRLIFLINHGYLPALIDHIDRNPLNNKIENLRPATREENNRNAKKRKDNVTGVKGVYLYKGKFIAHIRFKGKQNYLGSFSTIEEAKQRVEHFREKYHKDFANNG